MIGRDDAGRAVEIPERTLAAHGLILGATGAGKSTTLLTLLSDQIARGRPVVAIDLKGSPGFAAELRAAAEAAARPFIQWTPDGASHWNPLAAGNATELKDKLLGHRALHASRTTAVPPSAICSWRSRSAQETSPGQPLTLARRRRADGARAPRRREQAHVRGHAPST